MSNRSIGSWFAGILIGVLIFYVFSAYLGLLLPTYRMGVSISSAWLTFIAVVLGPIAAGLVAFFGQILSGVGSHTIWWTWVIADGIYGLLLGLLVHRMAFDSVKLNNRRFWIFNLWQVIANILVWLIIAPLGDMWVYGSFPRLVFMQGAINMSLNIGANATIGILMIMVYQRISKIE